MTRQVAGLMDDQINLFEPDPSKQMARRADPGTSHQAARYMVDSGKLGEHCMIALGLVKMNPGKTASELDAIAGSHEGKIRKRLNDLRDKGWAENGPSRRCARTGRMAQTWRPARRRAPTDPPPSYG